MDIIQGWVSKPRQTKRTNREREGGINTRTPIRNKATYLKWGPKHPGSCPGHSYDQLFPGPNPGHKGTPRTQTRSGVRVTHHQKNFTKII